MNNTFTMSTRYELTEEGKTRLSKVITNESGNRVEIPLNCNGSVKWFNDNQLMKKKETA